MSTTETYGQSISERNNEESSGESEFPLRTPPSSVLSITRVLAILRPFFLLGIAAVFSYSGIVKILTIEEFIQSIRGFRIPLGDMLETAVAAILPTVELVCAVALFPRQFRRGALVILGILCIIFFIALLQASLRGFVVDCGCFGKSPSAPTPFGMFWAILRDILLFVTVVYLYKAEKLTNRRKIIH